MSTTAETLTAALDAHGDTLYRLALLLGASERRAATVLSALAATIIAEPLATPINEAELFRRLLAQAHLLDARKSTKRQPTGNRTLPALYRSLLSQPIDTRMRIGLYLLLGYEAERVAVVMDETPVTARDRLIEALRNLGPATGNALTDRVSGPSCHDMRHALIDPAGHGRQNQTLRSHLAGCSACRNFDQSWAEIAAAIEAALRTTLRAHGLPDDLRQRMLAGTQPRRKRLTPGLRFVLPPLIVVGLIAVLVLPGFLRRPVTIVERERSAEVDPVALIEQALAQHGQPPPGRSGLWHARFETLWYFQGDIYAPLVAEAWLDATNPARHRLQLTHADGGAPFELQIGDGRERFYYGIDAAYTPTVYGDIPGVNQSGEPALFTEQLDAEAQEEALRERLAFGVWDIGPYYLRQALAATDLRLLGRQIDNGTIVQLLSYTGFSPLGPPQEATEATSEQVTILLALTSNDGRLHSAIELIGPEGTAQVGRTTWRLSDEEWIGGMQSIEAVLSIERAWNGLGSFPEPGDYRSADPALPAIPNAIIADPSQLMGSNTATLWLPGQAPPDTERALLIDDPEDGTTPIDALIYLGAHRRLIMRFNPTQVISAGETLRINDWNITLAPGRGQLYSLYLEPDGDERSDRTAGSELSIQARGYSRSELLSLLEDLQPFDPAILIEQAPLFVVEFTGVYPLGREARQF
jgi:hypothetical protein